MKKILFVLVPLILSACSTFETNGIRDENLLVPQPVPGSGWKALQKKGKHETVTSWVKTDERFVVIINHGGNQLHPHEFRNAMDSHAQEKLTTSFESKILKEGFANNYPMLFWQTSATLKNGKTRFTLLLNIKGNDATYLAYRSWDNEAVPDSEIRSWTNYLLSINLCDPRYPEHQCPDLKKVRKGN